MSTILIAHPDPVLGQFCYDQLVVGDAYVILVPSGEDSWAHITLIAIDLLVTATQLADMPGLILSQKLRRLPRYAALPIILVGPPATVPSFLLTAGYSAFVSLPCPVPTFRSLVSLTLQTAKLPGR
jgi:CheY-like chemotaxis protein